MIAKRKKSVGSTLFFSYVILVLSTIVTFTAVFYFFTTDLLKNKAMDALRDISSSLVNSLDSEISRMNIVSLNISYSTLLKQLVAEHLSLNERTQDAEQRALKYRNTKNIIDVISTIIGPFKPVPQVNYYDFKGEMIGAGVFSQAAQLSVRNIPWLEKADAYSGTKYLSMPHSDTLLEQTFPLYKNTKYISLYRTFFSTYREPAGVIEVKQFTDMVFKDFPNEAYQVLVLDSAGNRIYPFGNARDSKYAEPVRPETEEGEIKTRINRETRRREMLIVKNCRQSDWRIVVAKEERELFKPVYDFTKIIFLSGSAFILMAVFVASRLSRKLTTPLKEIHDAVSDLDWEAISSASPSAIPSDLNELEELQLAFQRMHRKLQDSMQQALDARTHEIQATMFALQAQMDPHFIYNMLTTISIMAEEGQREKISETVDNLTHLLRYISSSKSSYVTIAEEAEYAERYLACMKIRFQNQLNYSISIPESLLVVEVPKLLIQPIIENTMKYGIDREPPWNIEIKGAAFQDGWTITITDNGPGFNEVKLSKLSERIGGTAEEERNTAMQINGMGLLNIYYRLMLYYGDATVYSVGNSESGGARVIIGGPYARGKKV